MKEVLDKICCIEESIMANSVGLQNVYNEFAKYEISEISYKIDELNKRLDNYERDRNVTDFSINIQDFPLNIRVSFTIKTNFGEISHVIDYPPALKYEMGRWMEGTYSNLLETLYEEHEKRGGKFIGEEGCKDWMDKNGKTIMRLEPQLSSR